MRVVDRIVIEQRETYGAGRLSGSGRAFKLAKTFLEVLDRVIGPMRFGVSLHQVGELAIGGSGKLKRTEAGPPVLDEHEKPRRPILRQKSTGPQAPTTSLTRSAPL